MIIEYVLKFDVSGGIPALDAFGGPRIGPGGYMFVSDANIRAWLRKYWELLGLSLNKSWSDISLLSTTGSSKKNLNKIAINLDEGLNHVDALLGFPLKKVEKGHSWVFGPLQVSFAVSTETVNVSTVKLTASFASSVTAKQRSFGMRYSVWNASFIGYAYFTEETWNDEIWEKFFNGAGSILQEKGLIPNVQGLPLEKKMKVLEPFIEDSLRGALSSRFSGVIKIFNVTVEKRNYQGPHEMWDILNDVGGVYSE